MGFEPTASSMRPKRSSQLSYTPEGSGRLAEVLNRSNFGGRRCDHTVSHPTFARVGGGREGQLPERRRRRAGSAAWRGWRFVGR
jgi:hypothetical protein